MISMTASTPHPTLWLSWTPRRNPPLTRGAVPPPAAPPQTAVAPLPVALPVALPVVPTPAALHLWRACRCLVYDTGFRVCTTRRPVRRVALAGRPSRVARRAARMREEEERSATRTTRTRKGGHRHRRPPRPPRPPHRRLLHARFGGASLRGREAMIGASLAGGRRSRTVRMRTSAHGRSI